MSLGSLFKRSTPTEYPVLLCGLSSRDKSQLWQHWRNTYGVGKPQSLGNPRLALLEIPGGDMIKLYHVDSDGVDARESGDYRLHGSPIC